MNWGRPWVIGPFSREGHYYIDDADGFQVAEFLKLNDAALCISAANAFDKMLAALESVQADSTIETCPHCLHLVNKTVAEALVGLAQQEEKGGL